ncbi:MAG: hypothetical protein PHO41_07710 [Eubacteriales bacterium]|nr:hypothetical protein [Eubacteriales bacterium]
MSPLSDWEQEIPVIDDVLTVSSSTRKLELKPGERWLIKDLAAGMLLHGAQDAAMVLCDHVAGSEDAFVELMNQYAERLGMENTLYKNPLGAYSSEQTTTAADLMRLCIAALENDTLRELLGKSSYDALNGTAIQNRMVIMQEGRSDYDSRIKGIGEGSTASAGTNTLIYAIDGEKEYVFAGYSQLDDQRGSERNAVSLIDFFAGAYSAYNVSDIVAQLLEGQSIDVNGKTAVTPAMKEAPVFITVENSVLDAVASDGIAAFSLSTMPALTEPPAKGDEIGTIALIYEGASVAQIPLMANNILLPPEDIASPSVDAAGNNIDIPIYTANDWNGSKAKQTIVSQYGCYIIIGAAVLLSAIVLLVAGRLRRKRR